MTKKRELLRRLEALERRAELQRQRLALPVIKVYFCDAEDGYPKGEPELGYILDLRQPTGSPKQWIEVMQQPPEECPE